MEFDGRLPEKRHIDLVGECLSASFSFSVCLLAYELDSIDFHNSIGSIGVNAGYRVV